MKAALTLLLLFLGCSSEHDYIPKHNKHQVDTAPQTIFYEDTGSLDTANPTEVTTPPYTDSPVDNRLPKIRVFPSAIDIGPIERECSESTELTIRSVGKKPLVIDSIEWSNLAAQDVQSSPFPASIELEPGEEITIDYEYTETNGINDFARLFIRSNAINDPYVVVDQNFRGNDYPIQIDSHLGSENYRADVLFVIDNSCSMAEEQTALSDNAVKFASPLLASEVDFQIGVITTDSPALRGPIITPGTGDIVGELQTQFLAGVGGYAYETGMEMAYQATGALPSGGSFSWLSGILREDSFLTIVFVTDEPGDDAKTVIEYSDWFQSLYGPDRLSIFSVVNDIDPDEAKDTAADPFPYCYARYAPRYVELSMLNPGSTLNICGAWGDGLTMIAESSFEPILEFEMSRTPVDPDSIIVTIDGIIAPPGQWTYDNSSGNKIVFSRENAPTGEDFVQIEYEYLACR